MLGESTAGRLMSRPMNARPYAAWYQVPRWCDYDPDTNPEGDPNLVAPGYDSGGGVIECWEGASGPGLGFGTAYRVRAEREAEGDMLLGTQAELEALPGGWTKFPTLAAAQAHYTIVTGKQPDGVIR